MRTIVAAFLLLLAGCPPDPSEPTRPDEARACLTDVDCIPDGGDACGAIIACVDQRCEDEPSRFVPCR
jgi:hypothetical protein